MRILAKKLVRAGSERDCEEEEMEEAEDRQNQCVCDAPLRCYLFDQLITFRSFPTRNSKYLSVEKREQRGRIDKMLGSIPGNLDVTETMVQAAQLQLQSL